MIMLTESFRFPQHNCLFRVLVRRLRPGNKRSLLSPDTSAFSLFPVSNNVMFRLPSNTSAFVSARPSQGSPTSPVRVTFASGDKRFLSLCLVLHKFFAIVVRVGLAVISGDADMQPVRHFS